MALLVSPGRLVQASSKWPVAQIVVMIVDVRSGPNPSLGPLLRVGLVAELRSMVARCVDDGVGGVVRLHGEAGIGKTTLAETMTADAERRGMPVWASSASPVSQTLPYAVVDRLSAPTGERMLASLGIPAGDTSEAIGAGGAIATPQVSRFAKREAATVLFESRCQVPSLVLVDDLQWVDTASAEVIGDLARTALTHPVLLIVTHRLVVGDVISDLIDELDDLGSHSIAVPPLGAADAHALVTSLCGGTPSEALLERADGASGNPFLLCEYVNGLLAEGQLVFGGEEVGIDSGEVPESLRVAVSRELQRLGEEVTMVVRACSVQGVDIDVGALAATLEQSAIALAAPLDVAVSAGLLEERRGCLRFRHELLRAAVYFQMPVSVRNIAHQQLATALAEQGATAALVGLHLVLGERTDDPSVVERLQLAAEATVTSAPEDALAFLDRARSMSGIDLDVQRIIELARLVALTAVGRLDEAEAAANWLLEVVDDADRSMVLARLGGIATIMGDSVRGLDLLNQASECASGDLERSPILALASMTSATNGDYERSKKLATEALEVGSRANEPVGQSVGMALLARISTFGNDIGEGIHLGTRAVAIADADLTGTAHAYVPALHLGMTALDTDRLDLAATMAQKGNELAERYNMAWSLPLFGSLAAAIQYRRGCLDEAQAEAEVAADLAERTASRQAITWTHAVQALVAVDTGDFETAERCVEAAEESFRSGVSLLGVDHMILARARLSIANGDLERALSDLAAAWDLLEAADVRFCQPILAFDLAWLATELGDSDRLADTLTATESAASTSGLASIAATETWIRATIAQDGPAARRAVEQLTLAGRTLEGARWMASAPELVALDGDVKTVLDHADGVFVAAGASSAPRLVSTGASRAGSTTAQVKDRSGWDSLTATELEIVRYLADGCTNAEIAQLRGGSRRTVEAHLHKAYRKLGIDGRVKLTVVASERFRIGPD